VRPGSCKCACYPKNFQFYYKYSEWENEDWLTSDEEGTIMAYSRENKCLFFAYAKTGVKLKQGEMVLLYFGPLDVEQMQYDHYVSGRVFVARDQIMEKSHNPAWDPYDWYMLPVEMAICKREKHLERIKRKVEGGKQSTVLQTKGFSSLMHSPYVL
jgi:hypothetical protein